MTIQELRAIARENNLPWRNVLQHAKQHIAAISDGLQHEYAIRRDCFAHCEPRKAHMPFWKSFGQWNCKSYNGAFGGGNDYTVIPRWDEVAESMVMKYPELGIDDNPSETLYQFIISPTSKLPTREEAIEFVIEQAIQCPAVDVICSDATQPFVPESELCIA